MKHILITTIAAVVLVGCSTTTTFHDAAINGNIETVQNYLNAGADVNGKDSYGMTPLHNAAFAGHKEIVGLLISQGADVNAKDKGGRTPLDCAKDMSGTIKWSGKRNGEITWRKRWKTETAELLYKHGGKTGEPDLFDAVFEGNLSMVVWNLYKGNLYVDNTPLGPKVDVNATDDFGRTALHLAAGKGFKEIAERLIEKGADVNVSDKRFGYTPLHVAASEDNSKSYEVHDPLNFGYEPPQHLEIVGLLIAEGADVNATDKVDGNTPLDFAIMKKQNKRAALLRKHGGKTGEELKAGNFTPPAVLFKCPTCGGKVSSNANACPHCGEPNRARKKLTPK